MPAVKIFHVCCSTAFHEPSNEHAAPTELGEGSKGIGSYRHGAPTELFKPVHGQNARSPKR
jgi:hypothetical protein